MEIEVKKAVQIFFSNASFEMIYLEAFANALDADADEFKIEICANSTNPADLNSLIIKLWDNGIGFDEYRFSKFSKLLSVEDKTHKGLGRLVYLCYFDNVKIESNFSSSERHCSRLHFGGRKKITFWVGKEGATIVSMKGYVNDEPGYETIELMEDSVLYVLERKKLKELFSEDLHIANWGRRYAEMELLATEERLISMLSAIASERYKELLEKEPDLLQRLPLGNIATYLGITQASLSRIRAQIK